MGAGGGKHRLRDCLDQSFQVMHPVFQGSGSSDRTTKGSLGQSKRPINRLIAYFDLWGCERLPGSSNVHGDAAERQA